MALGRPRTRTDDQRRETRKEACRRWYVRNQQHAKDLYLKNRERNPVGYLLRLAKKRAKAQGLVFRLTEQDVFPPAVCPVLGIALCWDHQGRHQPDSPSLDRIDSSRGYEPGNVLVVSWRANSLKKDATPEELKKLSEFYQENVCVSR